MNELKKLLILFVFACCSSAVWASGVTLNMLNYLDVTDTNSAKVFDMETNMFHQKFPGINLVIENSFGEAYQQKLAALAASGQLPDVMYAWPGQRTIELSKNGLVQDLYPYLGSAKANFIQNTVVPQYNGALLELPETFTVTHVMYANKALLAKLGIAMPRTYDDLVKMTPKLKAAGVETILMANKATWVNESCLFSMVAGRLAGDGFLNNILAGKAKFTDKPFVDSLSFIKKMYDDGVLSQDTIQMDYPDVPNLFATGKGAFLVDGDWRVNAIYPLFANQSDVVLIPSFPVIPGELKASSGSSSGTIGTGFAMNKTLKGAKAQAAWDWISFYAGPEVSLVRLQNIGEMPSMKLDTRGVKDSGGNPLPPLVQQRIGMYSRIPVTTEVIDSVFSPKVAGAVSDGLQQIGLGAKTPEQVASDIQAAFDSEITNK